MFVPVELRTTLHYEIGASGDLHFCQDLIMIILFKIALLENIHRIRQEI